MENTLNLLVSEYVDIMELEEREIALFFQLEEDTYISKSLISGTLSCTRV